MFDADEYLRLNPDVLEAGADPHLHYLRRGTREIREPGRFWAADYLARYPDVQAAGTNPLIHYLRFGRQEGRIMLPPPAMGSDPIVDGSHIRMEPGQTGGTPLLVQRPVATRVGDRLTMTCQVEGAPSLFAVLHGPSDVLSDVEARVEPFLPVALLMAGAARRDLVIEAPVDADYLDTLRLQCIPLLRLAFGFPETDILVEAPGRHVTRIPPQSTREALLFSGGVDSLYSLVRLRELGHPAPLLVNVNAGAHGDERSHFQSRLLRIQSLAQTAGLDLLSIDTNFHEVVEIGHQYGHPFRTIAAAHTAHGAIGHLFLSTARAFQELSYDFVEWSMEAPGATVSNSVVWGRIPMTEIGYERTRFEKVTTIAEEPLSYHALDVCVDPVRAAAKPIPRPNCGECFKCVQTLFELELTGKLDRFATQFDIEAFRANRAQNVERIRARTGPGNVYIMARLEGREPEPPAVLQVSEPAWASGERQPGAIEEGGRVRRCKTRQPPVRLFWSTDHSRYNSNVGDELSPAIVRLVSQREVEWAPPEGCDLAAIGSIIEMALGVPRQTPTVIWGSGFISDGPPLPHAPLIVTALRGPDSAQRLSVAGDLPLGDPGLLASLLVSRRPAKRQAIGIVPHYADMDLPITAAWAEKRGRVISPRLPAMDFLKAVAACELILSSSLHGLIIADSLGVPNHWVRLSDRVIGHGFKFRDHLRCLGREPVSRTLPIPGRLSKQAIEDLVDAYGQPDVSATQDRLLKAYPHG